MSKKRRIFDIDLPEDDLPPPAMPAGKPERRGPMAAAVRETAESLSSRAEVEAQIRAENDRLAHEHVRLKKAGLITDLVPTDQIVTTKLIRDRADSDDDLGELIDSIRSIGLSNPIQVEQVSEGRYELIQGMRRLGAWRKLAQDSADTEAWARIPATIIARGEQLKTLYRRMVDENLVRKDISFAEMARLARDYAADPGVEVADIDAAVLELFRSANKQKRSYIRAFAQMLDQIGDALRHPEAIPRALGLDLRKRLADDPSFAAEVAGRLAALPGPVSAEAEVGALSQALAGKDRPGPKRSVKPRTARTTFRLERPDGLAKVTAAPGRLEIQVPTDFSALERRQLEAALDAFLDRIKQ